MLQIRMAHRYLSFTLILLAQFAVILGAFEYKEKVGGQDYPMVLGIANFVTFFTVLIVLEVFYRRFLKQEPQSLTDESH